MTESELFFIVHEQWLLTRWFSLNSSENKSHIVKNSVLFFK